PRKSCQYGPRWACKCSMRASDISDGSSVETQTYRMHAHRPMASTAQGLSLRADAGAHVVEHGGGRAAIQFLAPWPLVRARRRTGQHAGLAVELVAIEAEVGEPALHRLDLCGAQLRGLAPRRLERPRIENAVAQVADEQHIEVGEIVILDDVVVLRRQERWPV